MIKVKKKTFKRIILINFVGKSGISSNNYFNAILKWFLKIFERGLKFMAKSKYGNYPMFNGDISNMVIMKKKNFCSFYVITVFIFCQIYWV